MNPAPDAVVDGTVTYKPVIVKNIYGAEKPSRMRVINRTPWQTFKRTFKRSGKIVVMIICILPVAIFVHILLALSLCALLVAGGLFLWGLGDQVTYDYVEGICPTCNTPRV